MGVTLQAIVEVRSDGGDWCRHASGYWYDVCCWEFGKNYELSAALSELDGIRDLWPVTHDGRHGSPSTRNAVRPIDPGDDPEVSDARRDVDERDIAHGRRWAFATDLERVGPCSGSQGFSRAHFNAMVAACRSLVAVHGPERVRVLFYSC